MDFDSAVFAGNQRWTLRLFRDGVTAARAEGLPSS